MILNPLEIERESFRIISQEFLKRGYSFREEELPLVMRAVHATGDISLAEALVFHPRAVEAGLEALSQGALVVTDVEMIAVGINKKFLRILGARTVCLVNAEEIKAEAQALGCTRAYCALKRALALPEKKIIVVGNAPTALLAVLDHLHEGGNPPELVIGVPVGFVGAAEYKERLRRQDQVPFITLPGTRGGTPVAVALSNALLKLAVERCGSHVT